MVWKSTSGKFILSFIKLKKLKQLNTFKKIKLIKTKGKILN